jgi:hypothetical protein
METRSETKQKKRTSAFVSQRKEDELHEAWWFGGGRSVDGFAPRIHTEGSPLPPLPPLLPPSSLFIPGVNCYTPVSPVVAIAEETPVAPQSIAA